VGIGLPNGDFDSGCWRDHAYKLKALQIPFRTWRACEPPDL